MSRAHRTDDALTLRVKLLGPFRIERENKVIVLPRRKLEPLLAYLLLYPQPNPREKLAALFWGEFTDESARASLRTHLSNLKKQLGDDALLAERETVQFNPDFPVWLDVHAFSEQFRRVTTAQPHASAIADLEAAIRAYGGPLLADHYDDWILPLREQYQLEFIDAQLRLIDLQRAASEYEAAIESAQRILDLDPANEHAHQHLMFLYVVTGNRNAALEQYEKCVRALETELDAVPSTETIALGRWLKQTPVQAPTLATRLTNLPIPPTSFVGRTNELLNLKRILDSRGRVEGNLEVSFSASVNDSPARLVSLVGAGGSGKTRLAIQVGTELVDSFPDGVWWIELAPLGDGNQVPIATAKALAIIQAQNRTLEETIVDYLRSKRALLILDNCEHLLDAAALLAESFLSACPMLSLLTTSREPLNIPGEQVWRIPTLTVPSAEALTLAARAMESEAVRLFVERARAVRRDFQLTDENARAVVEICRRLDGIPLAIELAAARVVLLTPAQIAARLDDRFALLTQGSRTTLPRQQTLRALIDWSYELLSHLERLLYQRFIVFEGGASLDAIELICSDTHVARVQVFDTLAALVNKSILTARTEGSAARYEMLETLRQYGREKLVASGEAELFHDRHLDYWLELAEDSVVEEELTDVGRARLGQDEQNLNAAIHWALDAPQYTDLQSRTRARKGVRLTALAAEYWQKGNIVQEPYRRLQRALSVAEELGDIDIATRSTLLRHAGTYARFNDDLPMATTLLRRAVELDTFPHNGEALLHLSRVYSDLLDNDAARRAATQALDIYRAHHHSLGEARARAQLGANAIDMGDWLAAQQHLRQAVGLARTINQPRLLLVSLREQAGLAYLQGDLDAAERYTRESLALNAELKSDWFQATSLYRLGLIATKRGDWASARSYLMQVLELWDRSGKRSFFALRLLTLIQIEIATGQLERAAALWGASSALLQATATELTHTDAQGLEASVAVLRERLDEATRLRAYNQGNTMPYAQIVQFALNPA